MAIHKPGSGTTFPRGSVWWIQYFVRGRRVRESTGLTKKADAENLLKQRIGEVAAGVCSGPATATIADLCSLVLEDHRLRNLRSLQHVEWRYEAHIKPLLGSLLSARFGSSQVVAREAIKHTVRSDPSFEMHEPPAGLKGLERPAPRQATQTILLRPVYGLRCGVILARVTTFSSRLCGSMAQLSTF